MNKSIKRILLIVVCMSLLVATLAGCNNYKFTAVGGGDSTAVTENNGNRVVKQGNYIYFINGTTSADAANEFGEVEKGNIMRGTIADDGTISNYVTIVPKNVLAGHPDAGIYVFGEWLYYVTPNTNKDKYGNLQTDVLDFMRVKIDGTDTQEIISLIGASTQFRITKDALVYLQGTNLYTINLNNDKFEPVLIESNVTQAYMPYGQDFDPASKDKGIGDYIIYTTGKDIDSEDDGIYNYIMSVKADGSSKKELMSPATFANGATPADMTPYEYTITLSKYLLEDDSITLFYTASQSIGGVEEPSGLMSYTFDNTMKFDPAKQNEITYVLPSNYFIYSSNSVVVVGANLRYAASDTNGNPIKMVNISANPDDENASAFTGTYLFTYEGYMYYSSSSSIDRFELNTSSIPTGGAEKVYDGNISVSAVNIDLIGNMLFFSSSDDYSYTHMINLDGVRDVSTNSLKSVLVGIRNTTDQEAYEKAQEDKD